jgi:hypothetical protein
MSWLKSKIPALPGPRPTKIFNLSNIFRSPAGTSPQDQPLQVTERLRSFVGRAFRHDIKSSPSSGVLTPEGLERHFPRPDGPLNLLHVDRDRRCLRRATRRCSGNRNRVHTSRRPGIAATPAAVGTTATCSHRQNCKDQHRKQDDASPLLRRNPQ